MKGNMRGLIRTVPGRGVGWRGRVRWREGRRGGGAGGERSQAPTKAIDIPPVQHRLSFRREAPPQAPYSLDPKRESPAQFRLGK